MTDADVTVVPRGTIRMDRNFQLEAHTIARRSDPNPDLEFVASPIYNLVIDHPEGTVLWDTGAHPAAGEGHWPSGLFDAYPVEDPDEHALEDDLERVGYAVGDVDYVVQTHLHMDHAGGLERFAGTDTPVFVHEEELKYAYLSATTDEGSAGYVLEDFHHDLNWRLVHRERETPLEDLELLHLPGHTPGMLGTMLHLDDAGTLLFTSDLADVAANYRKEWPMGPGLLWNRQAWLDSVRTAKELERRHDAEVVYGHDHDQFEGMLEGWP
jgi:glyoxylase-like metal-dependent hydrolase (beta-lactamase superfamily II)